MMHRINRHMNNLHPLTGINSRVLFCIDYLFYDFLVISTPDVFVDGSELFSGLLPYWKVAFFPLLFLFRWRRLTVSFDIDN